MASLEHEFLKKAGFSQEFLRSAFGAHPAVKAAALSGRHTFAICRCRFCNQMMFNPDHCQVPILDSNGRDLSRHAKWQRRSVCSTNCFLHWCKENSIDPEKAARAWYFAEKKDFYRTREWEELRYEVLKERRPQCECCGGRQEIHVDHIKSRFMHPWLALDKSNLQILCGPCNRGKGWRDSTDWRVDHQDHHLVDRLKAIRDRTKRGV